MLSLLKFQNVLEQLQSQWQQKTYLLAVSGGVDSMVLADLFQVSRLKFQIAHINYHLRNEDSNFDQQLVSDFCERHRIPFHLYDVSAKDKKPENSIQNWARELRYQFFRKIQKEQNLEYLVTAHHLNDQLETFIINLSKASGIKGLSGIPANENQIIRPLLNFSKDEIYEFAKENKIGFREDVSNQKTDYLRNKVRHKVVPELENINENFLRNFSKSIEILNQTKDVLNDLVNEKINGFQRNIETGQTILVKEKFSKESDLIRFEILKRFGFNDEKEMQKIFTAQTGSSFLNSEFQLVINRNELILNQNLDLGSLKFEAEEMALEIVENEILIPQHIKDEILEFGNCHWKIDQNKIELPLKLRKKQEGDVFFPIGMIGKKKISKFFKDEKISILAKQKIWLLCDANNQIIGVLPFRQDGRFNSDDSESLEVKI
ncbi:tRNA lysidine(34) synthetase TilS [Epilithonimonas ginsengisoli]|uniref:tRNA(Ile)-lysidine synthase n=1 Tax=Epilithonimonas ginsengisoli TaxID=1245592 RepID=A0ABU4JG54_9FLAO|nr:MULTISPECIES: tRNA lysidine(34) synthetase TilS [Chryseobacterium group]MBV6880011.1 tRNA lysidine(34) synthetase TilS [Epilithonimonas sp. FP105]MDW8548661.1 tRNA lysidine(34) synthetase TilS [Epilithonimonas ginsengisoli]OAH75081.1 tRNA(Ile)-lysidine synthetase [Chryseobacterium sp. FP211-J200]